VNETPFVAQLKANIRKYVTQAKRDGTVGMSTENLIQCVKTPPHMMEGAPTGGNVQWQYRTLFREVLATMTFKGFEIIGGAR
jgi:surface antigen